VFGKISAVAALLVTILVACGGTSASSGDPSSASTTLSTDEADGGTDAASPAPAPTAPAEPTAPVCQTDNDCSAADLCVEHACREACRSKYDCESGFCNFDNDGHCFNEHGCNPPPKDHMCPMICWGYCDTPHDGG
jgi:hypothetical protein